MATKYEQNLRESGNPDEAAEWARARFTTYGRVVSSLMHGEDCNTRPILEEAAQFLTDRGLTPDHLTPELVGMILDDLFSPNHQDYPKGEI